MVVIINLLNYFSILILYIILFPGKCLFLSRLVPKPMNAATEIADTDTVKKYLLSQRKCFFVTFVSMCCKGMKIRFLYSFVRDDWVLLKLLCIKTAELSNLKTDPIITYERIQKSFVTFKF